MEIITLGTSAAIPTKTRRLASTALRLDNGHQIIFDIGEDFQRAFREAKLKVNKPTIILISHFHGDHVLGLPGYLATIAFTARSAPLILIGPQGLFEYINLHLKLMRLGLNGPTTIIEYHYLSESEVTLESYETEGYNAETQQTVFETYASNDSDGFLYRVKDYSIKGFPVRHTLPAVAFRFQESPRSGHFYPAKARALGIPPGPLYGKLKDGQIITWKGEEIDPREKNLVGPTRKGRSVIYTGDTSFFSQLIEFARDCDVLIAEATYQMEDHELAKEYGHMTNKDAATLAKESGARLLILTHFSSRYPGIENFKKEVTDIFSNIILGEDIKTIPFPSD